MSQDEEPIQVTLGGVIDERGLELAVEPEPSPDPAASASPVSASEPAAEADAHSTPSAEATGPSAAALSASYRVQPSDSWESIAAAHGVDPDALYEANAGDARVVNVGRHGVPVNAQIVIPGAEG